MEKDELKLDMNKITFEYINSKYFNIRGFLESPCCEDDEIKNEIDQLFKELHWGSLFLEPDFFLDDETGCEGIDFLHNLEGGTASEKLAFVSTQFKDAWGENYSSRDVAASEKSEWQSAFAGVCFMPDNEKWLAIYVDRPYSDFIVLSSDSDFISKVIKNIDPKLILF